MAEEGPDLMQLQMQIDAVAASVRDLNHDLATICNDNSQVLANQEQILHHFDRLEPTRRPVQPPLLTPAQLATNFDKGYSKGYKCIEGPQQGYQQQQMRMQRRSHLPPGPSAPDDSMAAHGRLMAALSQLDAGYRKATQDAINRKERRKKKKREQAEELRKITEADDFHIDTLEELQQKYADLEEHIDLPMTRAEWAMQKQIRGRKLTTVLSKFNGIGCQSGGAKSDASLDMPEISTAPQEQMTMLMTRSMTSNQLLQEELHSMNISEEAAPEVGQLQMQKRKEKQKKDIKEEPQEPVINRNRLILENKKLDCAVLSSLQILKTMPKVTQILENDTSDSLITQIFRNAKNKPHIAQNVAALRQTWKESKYGDLSTGKLTLYQAFILVLDALPDEAKKLLVHEEFANVRCQMEKGRFKSQQCKRTEPIKWDSYFVDMAPLKSVVADMEDTRIMDQRMEAILQDEKNPDLFQLQTQAQADERAVNELDVNDISHRINYDICCEGCHKEYVFAGQIQIHLTEDNPYLILYVWEDDNAVDFIKGIEKQGVTRLLGEDMKLISAIKYEKTKQGHFVSYKFDNETGKAVKFDDKKMGKKVKVNFDQKGWKDFRFFVFEREHRSFVMKIGEDINIKQEIPDEAVLIREPQVNTAIMEATAREDKEERESIAPTLDAKNMKTEDFAKLMEVKKEYLDAADILDCREDAQPVEPVAQTDAQMVDSRQTGSSLPCVFSLKRQRELGIIKSTPLPRVASPVLQPSRPDSPTTQLGTQRASAPSPQPQPVQVQHPTASNAPTATHQMPQSAPQRSADEVRANVDGQRPTRPAKRAPEVFVAHICTRSVAAETVRQPPAKLNAISRDCENEWNHPQPPTAPRPSQRFAAPILAPQTSSRDDSVPPSLSVHQPSIPASLAPENQNVYSAISSGTAQPAQATVAQCNQPIQQVQAAPQSGLSGSAAPISSGVALPVPAQMNVIGSGQSNIQNRPKSAFTYRALPPKPAFQPVQPIRPWRQITVKQEPKDEEVQEPTPARRAPMIGYYVNPTRQAPPVDASPKPQPTPAASPATEVSQNKKGRQEKPRERLKSLPPMFDLSEE